MVKLADSLRSSLSKISMITINDMFTYLKRCMEPDLDNLVKILLKKGTDTNSFISEESENALISMCTHCMDSKVLSVLMGQNINSKSNIMRQRICKCFETVIIHVLHKLDCKELGKQHTLLQRQRQADKSTGNLPGRCLLGGSIDL
jgi:CLASP N terminal